MRSHLSLAAIPPVRLELPDEEAAHPGAEQIFLHLDDRGFVPFHPALAERFGHKAAIFVGMALYWTRHSLRNHPERGGWFFMSLKQWQAAIGLTRTEQATVREQLMSAGVLEEMLIGRPAVMNYRLNVPALAKALALPGRADKQLSWETAQNWFRGCKVYYKPLADVAGSIAAGLYLAYLLQRYRECLKLGQLMGGSIPVGQDEISTALVLGPKVQRNARERLKRAGFIHEAGIGGGLVHINFEAILLCLRGQTIKPLPKKEQRKSSPEPTGKAEANASVPPAAPSLDLSGLSFAFSQAQLSLSDARPSARPRDLLLSFLADDQPPSQLVDFRQVAPSNRPVPLSGKTGQSGKAHGDFPGNSTGENPGVAEGRPFAVSCKLAAPTIAETCKQEPSRSAETCKLDLPFPAIYIQRSSFYTTTTTSSDGAETTVGSSSSPASIPENLRESTLADGLIFPAWLDTSLYPSVCKLLTKFPASEQQHALDEMDGAHRCSHQIVSPVAWMSGLVKNFVAGESVWAYAPRVAADRIASAKQAALRKAQEEASMRSLQGWRQTATNAAAEAPVQPVPVDTSAARAKLLELRNATASKIGRPKK